MRLPDNALVELEAAWTLAAVYSASPARRDGIGAPDGTYDFDLELPTGASIALEVTTATAPMLASFWHEVHRRDWSDVYLRRDWTVTLVAMSSSRPVASVKQFQREGIPLLRAIEADLSDAGIWVLGQDDAQLTDQGMAAANELRSMGVDNANALTAMGAQNRGGTVAVGAVVDAAATMSMVNNVLEDALADNADKLRRSATTERHLFIVVNDLSLQAFIAAATYSMPRATCALPDGINRVWLAPWLSGPNLQSRFGSLWFVDDEQPWRTTPVPAVRDYSSRCTLQCA
jgi:hypothetical protein